MNSTHVLTTALVLSFATLTSFAQAPAGAPAGSTGLCKDGTYTTNETKKGACSGHKGVKDWYGDKAAAAPAKAAPTAAAEPSTAAAPAKTTAAKAPAAGGGGPGQVWVNTETKVYHCQGTKWYGKTKQGEVFWRMMEFHRWAHPFDHKGKRRGYDAIPESIDGLRDDPYRSLAGCVRNAGGYAKDTQPYAEFLWADFFRSRIELAEIQPSRKGHLVPDVVARSVAMASGEAARYLPGWAGATPPPR